MKNVKAAPTLIDTLYRLTFNKETVSGWQDNYAMRQVLEAAHAHRFIVSDDRTAAFMAELANEAFIKYAGKAINYRMCESLRVSSRLPYPTVWIEYPLRAYQRRANELRGTPPPPAEEVAKTEGWLLQQHPLINTAISLHIFTHSDIPDSKGYDTWTFPFSSAWCCDDSPLPWKSAFVMGRNPDTGEETWASENLIGLPGYKQPAVGFIRSPLIDDPLDKKSPRIIQLYTELIQEWTGVMRRIWAFLATIDHLPLTYGQVRQSKGFLARGRIRKFMDHQTITLNVPARKDTRVLARQMIAIAHRKRHSVRAHWRDDWRNPPSKRCNPHLWVSADDNVDHIVCELCRGRQIYIAVHERGDASLGYVTHDYRVKHEVET